MPAETREQLIARLRISQEQCVTLLTSVAHDQDWQPAPDEWSFRYIAAHLATGEKECLAERLRQIATGTNPVFDMYLNSQNDFSGMDMQRTLQDWVATRQAICDYVRALPEESLLLTASHAAYGTITMLDYLRIWLEHDQEHLQDLEQKIAAYRRQG
jgi:hypothetical protein